MPDNSLTTIKTDRCRYRVQKTGRWPLGPVLLQTTSGLVTVQDYLEVGEARALIAALQLVVDDVEREGQEKFDSHIKGKLAETKFISMPSAGVSQNA
jgi:hypothetical protein